MHICQGVKVSPNLNGTEPGNPRETARKFPTFTNFTLFACRVAELFCEIGIQPTFYQL